MRIEATYNPAYDKAFEQYLRKGTPITEPYYLEDKIPSIYVWRTQEDEKVRVSHQENDGKVCYRDSPPKTGHPGQDYHCRCTAEPYIRGVTEYANQTIVSVINDAPKKWGNLDFVHHFYSGSGRTLTLSETGHLQGIINQYFYHLGVMKKINSQIIDKARKEIGYFEYAFENSYVFGGINKLKRDREQYLYSFGGSIIGGKFTGYLKYLENRMMKIDGMINYEYYDVYTDPLSLREIHREVFDKDSDTMSTDTLGLPPSGKPWTDLGGTDFIINEKWTTEFHAEALDDMNQSSY